MSGSDVSVNFPEGTIKLISLLPYYRAGLRWLGFSLPAFNPKNKHGDSVRS